MNPLDQLADISTPSTIDIWPLAWGYWLLIAFGLFIVIASVVAVRKHRKYYRVRNFSINKVRALAPNDPHYLTKLHVILKQCTQNYFPNKQVLNMSGQTWCDFVLNEYKGSQRDSLESLITVTYTHLYKAKSERQGEVVDNKKMETIAIDCLKNIVPRYQSVKSNNNVSEPSQRGKSYV